MTFIEINRRLITATAFTALALNGLTYTFMGTALPAIQAHLGISLELAGALMALFQAGVTVFTLAGGFLSDIFRRERILSAGCFLLCMGVVGFGASPSFAVSLILICLMGAGMGLILSGSNTLLVSLYPSRKGAIMNVHHVFFAVGSLVGPLIMGHLITRGNLWREGFIGEGILLLMLATVFYLSGGRPPAAGPTSLLGSKIGGLFRDGHYMVLLVVNALAMGVQVAVMLFGVTFLIQAKACTLAIAGAALALFSLFMVLGRLACGRLTLSLRQAPIILALLCLQVATLLLAWLGQGWLAVTALALSGFTFSGIYPTLLGLVSALFPETEGSALGILSTMGGLGAVLFCWLSGYLGDLIGVGNGFGIMILASFVGLLLFAVNYSALHRRESASIPAGKLNPDPKHE